MIPSYHAFGGYQYPVFIVLSEGRRLFRQKDGETVGTPIEKGGSNGGRGRIGGFGRKINEFPIVFSKDSQLFCLRWCEVVEGFSIGFGDIHIQIVVGDDTDRITGNV